MKIFLGILAISSILSPIQSSGVRERLFGSLFRSSDRHDQEGNLANTETNSAQPYPLYKTDVSEAPPNQFSSSAQNIAPSTDASKLAINSAPTAEMMPRRSPNIAVNSAPSPEEIRNRRHGYVTPELAASNNVEGLVVKQVSSDDDDSDHMVGLHNPFANQGKDEGNDAAKNSFVSTKVPPKHIRGEAGEYEDDSDDEENLENPFANNAVTSEDTDDSDVDYSLKNPFASTEAATEPIQTTLDDYGDGSEDDENREHLFTMRTSKEPQNVDEYDEGDDEYDYRANYIKIKNQDQAHSFTADNQYSVVIQPFSSSENVKRYLSDKDYFLEDAFNEPVILHIVVPLKQVDNTFKGSVDEMKYLTKSRPQLYICIHGFDERYTEFHYHVVENTGKCILKQNEYKYKGPLENSWIPKQ